MVSRIDRRRMYKRNGYKYNGEKVDGEKRKKDDKWRNKTTLMCKRALASVL